MPIEIGSQNKLFNLVEAKSLMPVITSITKQYRARLKPVQRRLDQMLSNDPRRNDWEREYQNIVSRWRSKLEQLGVTVAGLWLVEFNVGEGYLSWRHPELSLNHFRVDGDTSSDRLNLRNYIETYDPDWAR